MKKILFVMNTLECGGAEKALISILENIDYKKYEVDLVIFKHKGTFLNSIPSNVNLIPEVKYYKYFERPIGASIKELVKKGEITIAIKRIMAGKIYRTEKVSSISEQKVWKYVKSILKSNDKEYDAAIGFMERSPIYYVIDNVKAKKKIGWIHTDYRKLNLDKSFDLRYFKKLDYLVTISEDCANNLKLEFPEISDKIKVINNIVSPTVIKKLSKEEVIFPGDDKKSVKIVSVGRVEPEKGFDMAIEACNILKNKNILIKWYVVGDGTEREKLEEQINKYNLNDNFYILGIKENPYAYLEKADIYVQPSRYEGRSIAIDEAKIINMPIVVTNFNTAKYQIYNNHTGLIVGMNGEALAVGIEKVINDNTLRKEFVNNLKKEPMGNESEINKLYELI